MKIAVTGADGFLGWQVRCAARVRGDDTVPITRSVMGDPDALAGALAGVDAVLHCAGVNRGEDDVVEADNAALAARLTGGLDRIGSTATVVYANSVHSGTDSPFGRGKQQAADHLLAWGERTGAVVADVRVPNLFGEHGRPFYNSFVATFATQLAAGQTPRVQDDKEVPLLYVAEAADALLELAHVPVSGPLELAATPRRVSDVLATLGEFAELYRTGEIPDVRDPFRLQLFNAYRSYTFPQAFPIFPTVHADERGALVETVKAHGGQAQVFCSTSHPGVIRGQHFHRRKIERFQVISGQAEIALRRLFDGPGDVVRFRVDGERPAVVDMPVLWVHNITNVGAGELTTLFWAHELLDPQDPDTYPEPV